MKMKHLTKLADLGAIAFVGIGFTACSSDDDDIQNNGGGITGETVKTAFTLSITQQAKTRMGSGAAQEDGNFTAMDGIQLFPFASDYVDENTTITYPAIGLAEFSTFENTSLNAKIYNNVSVPVGVKRFVFYGKKKDGVGGALSASYETNTLQTGANGDALSAITFDLVPINKDADISSYTASQTHILAALNAIDVKLQAASTSESATYGNYATNWRLLTAGASLTIAKAVEDLYTSMKVIANGSSQSTHPAVAVCTVIEEYFTMTENPTGVYTAAWKTMTGGDPVQYPEAGFPDGSVAVAFDGAEGGMNEFVYKHIAVSGVPQSTLNKYVKPAQLYYFVNTGIKVSNSIQSDSYDSKSTWSDVEGLYTDGTVVSTTTRSIMLKDQIQYAVGRLDLQVQVANNAIYANGDGQASSASEQIVQVPTEGYTVNGILIGGQKQVGWNFTTNTSAKEVIIYDNVITTSGMAAKKGTLSGVNYTLALETAVNQSEYVCVEFVNTGDDFFGFANQLIPSGSKFYLVAKLDPSSATQPTNGATINQVFKQDYNTVVKLTIGRNALKKAYQTIPDLRSPKLELGLSVDLTWQQGLTFDTPFQ